VLPSRAGDNLFWLGRYVERAEAIMRFVRAYHIRLAETDEGESLLIRHLGRHLASLGIDSGETLPGALTRALESAVISAGHVRDRFSPDGWTVLNDLAVLAGGMRGTVAPGDETARAMGALLRRITGFSGLVHENMYRSTGWRFLSIGRSLERAIATAGALAALAEPEAPEGALDLAVEIGDSVMSHRRRYAVATTRETMLDLLAIDPMNPRSIIYQLAELRDHIGFLPGAEPHAPMTDLGRAVLQAHTGLAIQTPDRLDDMALMALRAEVEALSDLIAETYFR
jgi:uncharacterized alpha-E superfamily protein